MTYECSMCSQHYCTTCEPGDDSCPVEGCARGVMCSDCASDHAADHEQEQQAEADFAHYCSDKGEI